MRIPYLGSVSADEFFFTAAKTNIHISWDFAIVI